MDNDPALSIAEMARATGLSTDTLRWYEREGVLPRVPRSSSGHRRYHKRDRDLLILLVALRDAGMSVENSKRFVTLLFDGAASHGERIELLKQTREQLDARRQLLERASRALNTKIAHYEELIELGLDCGGAPEATRETEAARA